MVKGTGRYRGEADQAERLRSARVHAGFRSTRSAAMRFGLPLWRLRAQENAEVAIAPLEFAHYAEIFRVDKKWLKDGAGRGPTISATRQRKLARKARMAADQNIPIEKSSAARLRLARRLAGYQSVQAAATAHGWTRSRVSAHEIGQNPLSPLSAHDYARAFGVNDKWLLTGEGPSGYPQDIEAKLGALLALHEKSDRQARPQLPAYSPKRSQIEFPIRTQPKPNRSPRRLRVDMDILDEYDEGALLAACGAAKKERKFEATQQWGFPAGFTAEVFRANPVDCFIAALRSAEGRRLIVDSADTRRSRHGVYAVYHNERIALFVAPDDFTSPSDKKESFIVLGRVVGEIGPAPHHPRALAQHSF